MGTSDGQAIQFATQMFDLLDRASTTSTYKYAVLLGLLECCQAQVRRDGSVPATVTTRQLAEKVVALYWAQTKPYAVTGGVLQQNSGSQAKILSRIEGFRGRHGGVSSAHVGQIEARKDFEKLVRQVEWSLVKMPLPRLQRVGGEVHEFLYSIGWDDGVRKRASGFSDYVRGKESTFDNRIMLKPRVGGFLVRLGPLLRPLIRVTDEQFHGEPIELGRGVHVTLTINVHDGQIWAQRFETRKEAQAQLERNKEADAPFVGVALD